LLEVPTVPEIDWSDPDVASEAGEAGGFPKEREQQRLETQRAGSADPKESEPLEGEDDQYDDPTMQTRAGEEYLVHGVGVFEYASAGGMQSQVYMCPTAACTATKMWQGECPTFISAVAVRTPAHTLILRGGAMYLDGQRQQKGDLSGNVVYQGEDLTVSATAALLAPHELPWAATSAALTEPHAPAPLDASQEQPRVAHNLRRRCRHISGEEKLRSSHLCRTVGWRLRTEEITIDVGVVGPYELGWLNERVSNRTFLVNVSAGGGPLRGFINGAKTSSTYFNVPDSDVIFPADQKEEMDAQCGAGQALRLLNASGVLASDIRHFRERPVDVHSVGYAVNGPYAQMRHS
jgi:hypothetical protein